MEHVDWVSPDNIVLANSTSDASYKKMMSDMYQNDIKVRLLKTNAMAKKYSIHNSIQYFFRYVSHGQVCWFGLGNPEPRKGVYYTSIYSIDLETFETLNNLYKAYDREDKLNKLLGDEE
jgi:hypothetical protein